MPSVHSFCTLTQRIEKKIPLDRALSETVVVFYVCPKTVTRSLGHVTDCTFCQYTIDRRCSEPHYVERVDNYLTLAFRCCAISSPDDAFCTTLRLTQLLPFCCFGTVIAGASEAALWIDASLLIAAVTAGASACGEVPSGVDSSEAEARGASSSSFDVNDVSILFPLPKTDGERSSLIGASELLSTEQFAQLLEFAEESRDPTFRTNGWNDVNRWRVIGLRVDPCSRLTPTLTVANDCHPQILRLA